MASSRSGRCSSRSPIRGVLVGLLIGLLSVVAGVVVGAVTLPTSEDLQRATVEELGLDADVLDHPLLGPVLDDLSSRVERRVVDEARVSVVLAVGTAVGVAAVGVTLVAVGSWRRRCQADTRNPS